MVGMLPHLKAVLIQAREAAGATQTDVAKTAKLSPGSVSRFETNKTESPRDLDRYVLAYATVTGTNAVDLWRHAFSRMEGR